MVWLDIDCKADAQRMCYFGCVCVHVNLSFLFELYNEARQRHSV